MAYDPIAQRYAQAAFEAAKAEGLTGETREHLFALAQAASRDAEVAKWLANPDVTADEKLGALERAVQGQWPWVVKALLATMLTMGRPEYVEQIAEAFIALDDRDQGRLRVLVRSARVVSQASLTRLQRILERWQGKHVTLETEVSPALIGGLQVQIDHRVIDGSVAGQLHELEQCLMRARVH